MPKVTPPINSFRGEFDFLSNFYPSPLIYQGEEYPTVEHAFQAAKSLSQSDRLRIKNCGSPGAAKKLGRRVKLRHDWEQIKLEVMEELLRHKFLQNQILLIRLLETGKRKLIEGNYWKDTYWGVYQGEGQNHLGRLLMKLREEFQ
jgi:ribA/ribD-fused uncharacterized protein